MNCANFALVTCAHKNASQSSIVTYCHLYPHNMKDDIWFFPRFFTTSFCKNHDFFCHRQTICNLSAYKRWGTVWLTTGCLRILALMPSSFLDVTQHWIVVIKQSFGTACPEISLTMNQRRVTSPKSEDFIYSVAEAWNYPTLALKQYT